jgi:hypothetical protein
MRQLKRMLHKFAIRSVLLVGTTTLLATLAFVPRLHAQVAISINPPVCSYGYYDYAPYGCAPSGFYGPGYFYNGIFLGVGPWASWGYGHGWGDHRFSGGGGGRYVGVRGSDGGRVHAENRGHPSAGIASRNRSSHSRASAPRSRAVAAHSRPSQGASHGTATHADASHAGAPHASHTAAARSGASHGGERAGSHGGSPRGGDEHH